MYWMTLSAISIFSFYFSHAFSGRRPDISVPLNTCSIFQQMIPCKRFVRGDSEKDSLDIKITR